MTHLVLAILLLMSSTASAGIRSEIERMGMKEYRCTVSAGPVFLPNTKYQHKFSIFSSDEDEAKKLLLLKLNARTKKTATSDDGASILVNLEPNEKTYALLHDLVCEI